MGSEPTLMVSGSSPLKCADSLVPILPDLLLPFFLKAFPFLWDPSGEAQRWNVGETMQGGISTSRGCLLGKAQPYAIWALLKSPNETCA
jgi:hypothetical protein